MDANASTVYVTSIVLLFVKHVATITIQAAERNRTRKFRYPEDAAFWKGQLAEDTDLCQRAQQLLRNDSESHPYYFAIGAAYVVLGAWPAGAPLYLGVYALSRVMHAYWLLRPRQPHRNRAFAVGIVILVGLSLHLGYAVIGRCVRG
jgi:hypothetical protein